jgi:N-acetylneuraminic acid mutarotase
MGLILRHLVRAFILTIPCVIIAACGDGGSPATPVPAKWAPTASMTTPRASHTATLLQSGKVLAVGGTGQSGYVGTELFDPAAGSWSLTGNLAQARSSGFTATALANGMVLVVGGFSAPGPTLGSAELYDPASGQWSSAGYIGTTLTGHTATLLPSGKVLVAGGSVDYQNGPITNYAFLYDPVAGTWSPTGNLLTPRYGHSALLLASGKVLAVSGENTGSSELYDPASGTWSATGSLIVARNVAQSMTLLANGMVLIAGGNDPVDGSALSDAEIYDPAAGGWSKTGSLVTPRVSHTATLLPDGKVLVAGGFTGSSQAAQTVEIATAELYDPASGTWTATANMTIPRAWHTATLLQDDDVLVAGGASGGISNTNVVASAEIYYP